MQWSPFVMVATGLDALPVAGRVMLLALLLSCALYGFLRVLPNDPQGNLNVMYCKGALASLLLVPALVYMLGIRVPVPVEQLVQLNTPWPRYISLCLVSVWLLGCGYHLGQLVLDIKRTLQALSALSPVPKEVEQRARHWQQRLNLRADVVVRAGGAEQPWHSGALLPWQSCSVVLPTAALNWPTGVQDVLLLGQMAQLQQGGWRWLMIGRLVQALYWPMPWVARLTEHLSLQLETPGQRLAASAYRDAEGWQRDQRNMVRRAATLQAVSPATPGGLVRLPNSGRGWLPPPRQPRVVIIGELAVDDLKFEEKWADTKAQRRAQEQDPHEQAYWLIAVASILVGVATTLTQVPAAPEFEPQFLKVRWQDQMLPRMRDYGGAASDLEEVQTEEGTNE